MLHEELTHKIIGAFYQVFNTLGSGFLEKVYENALVVELNALGLELKQQESIQVHYKGALVGQYYADLMVNDRVILELKSVEAIADEHCMQLLNYLKATKMDLGLVLNFGKRPEFKRIVNSVKSQGVRG